MNERTAASIPTISAAVSTTTPQASSNKPTVTMDHTNTNKKSCMEMVQQKFKENESVLSIFEAYQIVELEHSNRLLALVVSVPGGTYAVFSMTALRLPPRSCDDLAIDKIFPLKATFQMLTEKKGSVSKLQFELKNADEPAVTFYYYPMLSVEGAEDADTFHANVMSAKTSMAHSSVLAESVLSYAWINDYRQIGEAKQELKRRESEYIIYKSFKIYCATWNVNGKACYINSPLDLWLSATTEPPDIYAVGLQEVDMSATAVALSKDRPDPMWNNKLLESLNRHAEYELLDSTRLVGMALTIFVRKEIRTRITRCITKTIPRGIMNTFGNKGGVAVSIKLNEGSLCFVNSHLAAHLAMVEARNEDYLGIERGIEFSGDLRRIANHDHIFWLGDLNYRIDEPPGLQLPYNRSDIHAYEILMPYDQLRREMRKGNCFQGYREGDIKFKPTYKYDVGTDNFDSSEKQRAPAYCDRVLWKGSRIEQLAYDCVMEVRQSDHKPVYALFDVKVKTKDEKKYKMVHEQVLKLVDKRENENQPQISVEKSVIDFGEVRFNEMAVQDFTVSNSCHMTVDFMFKVKDPPLNDICEKWLRVEPTAESLMPDSAKSIRVRMMINEQSVRGLLHKIRTTGWKIDFDILILHVENGPDMFITVTGEYKPSCFGLSMETLCRTERPLCEYTQTEVKELMCSDSSEFRVTMPREFFLLIDYLHNQGKEIKGAFSKLDYRHSRSVQFNEIRDWLDSWSNNEFPGTPHAAAEALLMLLDLPEEPLLHPCVDQLLRTHNTSEAMEIISNLSSPKRNVFVHLCMFLRVGIERHYYEIYDVAHTFGRILLRNCSLDGDKAKKDAYRETLCRDFMYRFLKTDTEDGTLSSLPVNGGAGDNHADSIEANFELI